MKAHKKVVVGITVFMVIIGVILLTVGLLSGPRWFTVIFGVSFFIAAYIAYQSGISYINELIEKKKNDK